MLMAVTAKRFQPSGVLSVLISAREFRGTKSRFA